MAEQRGGRPIAASQRPTGTDKAIATGKKQYFRRKKVDRICLEKIDYIDYKDVRLLSQFVTERGKIIPRRISGLNALNQRRITEAIALARNIALLPFAGHPGPGLRPERPERRDRDDRGDRGDRRDRDDRGDRGDRS
jgi:small subunit ribosomal protein S18